MDPATRWILAFVVILALTWVTPKILPFMYRRIVYPIKRYRMHSTVTKQSKYEKTIGHFRRRVLSWMQYDTHGKNRRVQRPRR